MTDKLLYTWTEEQSRKLRRKRKRLDLSIELLAQQLGIGYATLKNMDEGQVSVTMAEAGTVVRWVNRTRI